MPDKKICSNCSESLKESWDFCPHCGETAEKDERIMQPFGSVIDDIDKEFERVDKTFDSFRFPHFKVKPAAKGGGINIIVRSGTGMRPKIEIKTAGNFKKFEPEMKTRLAEGMHQRAPMISAEKPYRKITEEAKEPETDISAVDGRQVLSIRLPGVRSEGDIEIKRLEQSLEVKAFAGDKTYFKLIPVPGHAKASKRFSDGVLTLEIEG